MKKIVAVYLTVVIAGILTSVFVSNRAVEGFAKYYSISAATQIDYSLMLDVSLRNIEQIENGDMEGLIQSQCMLIHLSQSALNLYSDTVHGLSKVKTDALIAKSQDKMAELVSSGKCSL